MEENNMKKENLVYFELNDWFGGRDYPYCEPFKTWVSNNRFITDDAWCKKNKLAVLCGNYDMSINWCITATESWVMENCPQLLSHEKYTYIVRTNSRDGFKDVEKSGSFDSFIRTPDENGEVYGRFGWKFLEYTEENFGVHYHKDDYEFEEDDDEEDEENEDE